MVLKSPQHYEELKNTSQNKDFVISPLSVLCSPSPSLSFATFCYQISNLGLSSGPSFLSVDLLAGSPFLCQNTLAQGCPGFFLFFLGLVKLGGINIAFPIFNFAK